jgi:two-component system, LytTR family, sensor kinase
LFIDKYRFNSDFFAIFITVNHRRSLHILFWLAYLLFKSYVEFAWLSSPGGTTPLIERWWMAFFGEVSQLIIKIPLSYFIIYLVNNLARTSKPFLNILAGMVAFALAVVLQRFLIIKFILPHLYHEETSAAFIFNWQRMITTFLDLVFIVGIAVAIKEYRLSQRSREREKGLVKEKLEAELKFLRTQTNPHFLFNTLNNIYALARKKSDDTADVVLKLSKLLRFMLYESRSNSISIAEELRVLNDYIELEKIRYNERLTICFTRAVDDDTQPIAPLILLPFAENAFKHGASETRFNSFIRIHAQLQKGQLIFTIENSREEEEEEKITENIGLSNVRRQLELMYPEHSLKVEPGKNIFKIALTINLHRHAAV